MLQASGEVGISCMTDLFNGILDEYKIPGLEYERDPQLHQKQG